MVISGAPFVWKVCNFASRSKINPPPCGSASAPSRYDFTCNSKGGSKYSSGALNLLIEALPAFCADAIARQNRPQKAANKVSFKLIFALLSSACLLVRIFRNHQLPFVLGSQNHFNNFADCSISAR